MTPYFDDGQIQIYHGRAEEVLPQLPACSLLLADPPYGIDENSAKQKSRGKLAAQRDYGEYDWDKEPPPEWMFGLMRAKSKRQIIWGGNYFPLPVSSCWLVWDKDNGATDYADCELAWTNLPAAVRKFKWKWQGMLQENMGRKDVRVHPTQKPLALIKWCITLAGKADSIIDPYVGSGTTLRAAKDFGIPAIGIDISERYCEEAARRLGQQAMNFNEVESDVELSA